MDIKGFKLATGQEIIAEVLPTRGTPHDPLVTRVLRHPLGLRVTAGPDGMLCDFSPWTIIADGDIALNRALVVAEYDVPKDVQDAYLGNVTGLQIVSGGAQILHG
jgi:hypothetical protein